MLCALAGPVGAQEAAPVNGPQTTAPTAEPQGPQITPGNLDALAATGAFREMLRRASSFSGRVVVTKTVAKDGQIVTRKTVDYQTSYLGDGDGHIGKQTEKGSYTVTTGAGQSAVTKVEAFSGVNDGKTTHKYYSAPNAWFERATEADEISFSTSMATLPQITVLVGAYGGANFEVSARTAEDGNAQRVFREKRGFIELVFDAQSGVMQSFKTLSNDGETVEMIWKNVLINQAVDPGAFIWTAPAGSKQVPAGTIELKIDL